MAMGRAKRMRKSKDVKVFRGTYNKTKRINRATAAGNGGIRF